MLKIPTFLCLLFSISVLTAQTTTEKKKVPRLSFDYTSGYQHLKMKDVNQFYLDSFAMKYQLFDQHIHSAYSRTFQVQYQISPLIGLGIQTKFDHARIANDSPLYVIDSVGNILNTITSHNELSAKNLGIGFFASLNGVELIQRITGKLMSQDFKMDVQIGTAYHFGDVTLTQSSIYLVDAHPTKAKTLGGNIQLKLSYPLLKSRTSTLRLKMTLGYQYAHTQTLQYFPKSNFGNNDWIVQGKYPITADFSGFNAGLGLSYEIQHRSKQELVLLSRNALYLDIFGQSLYGALMYERIQNAESTGVQHGLAAGIMFLNRIPWDYLRVFTLPLSYSAYFDFNRTKNSPHKLELGCGLNFLALRHFESTSASREQYLFPSVRIGYCYHSYHNGLLFKATFTPALAGFVRDNFGTDQMSTYFGSAAFFDNRAFPWVGLSIGKTF